MKLREIDKRLKKIEADRNLSVSKAEHTRIIKELEEIIAQLDAEYNSPDAVAKRKEWYEEIQRIGKLREQAFLRGEPMDNYPLPWQKKD